MASITDIRPAVVPISSAIANAYIDFSKMTASVVALVSDVIRDGRPLIGYGFNSNGRYASDGLLRERYGLTFGKSDFHVSVANVPEGEAGLLDLPSSEPCLLMRSVVYDVNERPVESLVSWNHPDRVAFESLQADGNALESVYTDWARSPQGTAPDGRN